MESPCYNCQNRTVGCHSTCAAYITYDNYRVEQRRMKLERQKDFSRASKWENKFFKCQV